MAATAKPRSRFGEQLRAELDRQNLSIRALGRRLNPDNPEIARRQLGRWIAGAKPTAVNRALVADALGVPLEHFADDDDEEEDSAVFALVQALMRRIDQRVEERLAACLAEVVA